jgi:hypothetical protein
MNELELFLLTRVLTPNFNTMDLVKILEKNQKLYIQIVVVTLKVRTLPFSPWAVLATWLHVGAP